MGKIVIDAGHGGRDPGAVGNGLKEKDINLTVAIKLAELLKGAGHTVVLTRTTDVFLEINERARISNKAKADYFVSVHHNASGTGKGVGYEVIHSVVNGKGKELAEKIGEEFEKIGQVKHGKAFYSKAGKNGKDYFGVIRDTHAPAIITEFGYIDNAKDASKFNAVSKLHKQAEAIANGILRQLGTPVKKTVEKTVKKTVAKPKGDYGVVTASVLNVRAGHSAKHAVLGTLKKGEKVRISASVNNWYSLYWGYHGGWVNSKYIKLV